jgi:hypothetical protein
MSQEASLKQSDLKICIPRIESNISNEYIFKIFSKLRIGVIEKITDVPLRSDSDYKRVFIKIKWDRQTPNGGFIYNRLNSGETVKVVYETPWYWKIMASKI